MQLGMFMQPVHDVRRDYTRVLEEDRETIVLADRLGFLECWIGEHFSATTEPITAPLVFLATLIERTRRIKLGTGVFCLPLQHPAVVASQAAMFDHLAQGRFQMGIGSGSLSSDLELFKVGGDVDRGAMVRESINTILAIWAGEPPYVIEGEYWDVRLEDRSRAEFGVGEFPKPLQKPHPPIAVSLMAPGSRTPYLAGERGWIPISGANLVQPRYVREHWEQYAAGCEAAGRRPDPSVWRVARSVVVGSSDAEAEDYLLDPDGPMAYWFAYTIAGFRNRGALHLLRPDEHAADGGEPPEEDWTAIARSMVAWGSPATVAEKIAALRDETGDFGVLTVTAHEWDDADFARRSLTRLAREVMPRFGFAAPVAAAAPAAALG